MTMRSTSLLAAATLLAAPLAMASAREGSSRERAQGAGHAQVVEISVTSDGFVPARATVKAGKPVTLVVTRKVERTCATQIVLADLGIREDLPLGKAVEVTFTPKKPGEVRYACGMDMIAGALVVE